MKIRGRHTHDPRGEPEWTATLTMSDDRQKLRINDTAHQDFWLEVEFETDAAARVFSALSKYPYDAVAQFVGVSREEWESLVALLTGEPTNRED